MDARLIRTVLFAAAAVSCHAGLPVFFAPGRPGDDVQFVSRQPGHSLLLTAGGATLGDRTRSEPVRMRILGANPRASAQGAATFAGKMNYFLGDDPGQWRTNVPMFARVEYKRIYPGIDLVYHGRDGFLEYDFVVSKSGDPSRIKLAFDGAEQPRLDPNGDLVLRDSEREIRWRRPFVYQDDHGVRLQVAGGYRLDAKGVVSFHLGRYNHDLPLIIDPVLQYSSFLGGSKSFVSGDSVASSVAVDSAGFVYIAGTTAASDFPVGTGVMKNQPNPNGTSAYVLKLSPDLKQILYATYYGGDKTTSASSIAVDSAGSAYFAGATQAANLPRVGSFSLFSGGTAGYVAKLSPSGNALVYASYVEGAFSGIGSIALTRSGELYLAGSTAGALLPIRSTLFSAPNDARAHGFVIKLSSSGGPVWGTYLAGESDDRLNAVAADANGDVYVTGATESASFPTRNNLYGHSGGADVFVTKIRGDGSAVEYSTFLGGSGFDRGHGIAVDASGSAYVTGATASPGFPQVKSIQSFRGVGDAFAVKLAPDGRSLVYSTFLGGSDSDGGNAIAVDPHGAVHIAGFAASKDFPLKNEFQAVNRTRVGDATVSDTFLSDGFVAKLGPDGSSLLYSSYAGSVGRDSLDALALDAEGNLLAAGASDSRTGDFPATADALQPRPPAAYTNVLIKVSPDRTLRYSPDSLSFSALPGGPRPPSQQILVLSESVTTFTVSVTPASVRWLTVTPSSGATPAAVQVNVDPAGLAPGRYDATLAILAPGSTVLSRGVSVQLTVASTSGPVSISRLMNGASFVDGCLASEEFATIKGTGLASSTLQAQPPYPAVLSGTSVHVVDGAGVERTATLSYVSSGQVNFLVPQGLAQGTGRVSISTGDGTALIGAELCATSPGLFTADSSGSGAPSAVVTQVGADGAKTDRFTFECLPSGACSPAPIRIGTEDAFLTLYGTGIRNRTSLGAVTASLGATALEVLYAGPQGSFPGLDQVNLRLPAALDGAGLADLALTVDGKPANVVQLNFAGP